MKKFRKLIPAMCMLLISAVLVGTSTFAWFSMQESVTVSGLQVTAKTDQPYLIIGDSTANTVALLQELPKASKGNTVALTVEDKDAAVVPCAHNDKLTVDSIGTAGNWYTKVADATTASTSTKDATVLTSTAGYVITKTAYMTIAKDTTPLTGLKYTVTMKGKDTKKTATEKIDAARIVFAVTVGETKADLVEVKGSDAKATAGATGTLVTTNINGTTLVTVVMYIYIDGNDDSIYTDNIANLDGASIDVTFTAVTTSAQS